jgi:hypothetical protein
VFQNKSDRHIWRADEARIESGMSEAQLGLVLTTLTILAFVPFMYRRGAIPLAGAIAAAATAVTIATVLFLAQ